MKKRFLLGIILVISIFILMFIPTKVSAKASNKKEENYANVVIFAHFRGEESETDKKYFENNRDKLIKLYNGTQGRSVTNYLKTISYSKFNIKNIFPQDNGKIINSLELPFNKDDAYKKNIDQSILNYVIEKIPNIKDYTIDYNNDGFVDNLTIVLKGGEKTNQISSETTFVNHKNDYPGYSNWSGKKIGTYNILNTYSVQESTTASGSGVIVHEFLHSLGYPDLYRKNGSDHPVYTWDIMASANYFMPYPLSYLRMHCTNWIDIETVTTSKQLKLDVQSNANGNQAYILKSPLNDYEFFVVEFRKKAPITYGDEDSLDRGIGGSGVIVYRIDTTATGLSNYHGGTGVYIFRPNVAPSGLNDTEAARINNAYLSKESGRTKIGTSDMNAGLQDGALTFSDGTNSGIVIKNVSSAEGNYMTLDVEIPSQDIYDLWKDTSLNDLTGGDKYTQKIIQIEKYCDVPYLVSYCNKKIYTQSYENKKWITKGTYYAISGSYVMNMELKELNNELYLIYSTDTNLKVMKWNEEKTTWSEVASTTNTVSNFSANVVNGKLYIAMISGNMSDKASLYVLNGNKIDNIGTYCNEMSGQPKVISINNKIYITTRLASGKIKLYLYNNNSFNEISNNMSSNTYDVKTLNNKMYFVLGSTDENNLNIYNFDGNNWSNIKSEINVAFPTLTVSQGNLYILAYNNKKLIAYSFNEKTNRFIQEGTTVDTAANDAYLTSIGNNIYIAICRSLDGTIAVKEKETVNSLISLTIVPPKKYTYSINEKIDTTGLQVIANYKKEKVVVNNYSIKGFDTTTSGIKNVTIKYEDISNTFTYEVIGKGEILQESQPEIPNSSNTENKPAMPTNNTSSGNKNETKDEPIIANGTYIIESALNSNKVLDIRGGKTANRTNIHLYDYNGLNSQKWNVKYLGKGYYSISSKLNNKFVMDVSGAKKANKTNVQIYTSSNNSAQTWIIKSTGDGYFYIISKCNNLYLDVTGGKTKNKTNIQMYKGNKTAAQKFKFVEANELSSGEYIIESKLDKNMVLDVERGKTKNKTNVQLYKKNKSNAQKWIITKMSDGTYEIKSKLNNKSVLDVQGAKKVNKTNVQIYEKHNSSAQIWILKPDGNGYYSIISKCNNLNLDIKGRKAINKANIHMYENNNKNSQKFKFIKLK